MTRASRSIAAAIALGALGAAIAACSGAPNTPQGSVVGTGGGGPIPPPTQLVNASITVVVPAPATNRRAGTMRPSYLSAHMQSLVIEVSTSNGVSVTGANATSINTYPRAKNCARKSTPFQCTGTTLASPGQDVFNVTTFAGPNGTGSVLSAGTVNAHIGGGGGAVTLDSSNTPLLGGIVARLTLSTNPTSIPRGKPATVPIQLQAFDAAGAAIQGRSDYQSPVTLTIQGDSGNAFTIQGAGTPGPSVVLNKPSTSLALVYDGNAQASSVTLQANSSGPNQVSANAPFVLQGTPPPPPPGTIFALNAGTKFGQGATVTVYDGSATGNVAPKRTLSLDAKLYARSIAVDATGNLYVGYLDSQYGANSQTGAPDKGNEIAVFAPGASGNATPKAVITAGGSSTLMWPVAMAFDPQGDLVTYGSTTVDGNAGDAVIAYAPGSSGAATPAHAWAFSSPTLFYSVPGPNALALDASGNFYLGGALKVAPNTVYGVFVNPASAASNPASSPARTIPYSGKNTQVVADETGNVALDSSGEIFVSNILLSNTLSCQARANVFAAGTSGGTTDVAPLRIITLAGVTTTNPFCYNPRNNPLFGYYPFETVYGLQIFVADEFNNAVDVFAGSNAGTVNPTQAIAGSSTGLNTPIGVVVSPLTNAKAGHR